MTRIARSKAKLIADGYMVEIVERWNQFARVRKDLFGFIDILAIKGDQVVGVQVTAGNGDVAKHIDKIRSLQSSSVWLDSPHRSIVIHSWEKRGERGQRKVWTCVETEILF